MAATCGTGRGCECRGDFEFLLYDNACERLTPVLCNYFALGQFELARATLRQLCKVDPDKAVSILVSILQCGAPKLWHLSSSVQSSAHLAWMCLLEFLNISEERSVPDISEIVMPHQIEFELVVCMATSALALKNKYNPEDASNLLEVCRTLLQSPDSPIEPSIEASAIAAAHAFMVEVPHLWGYILLNISEAISGNTPFLTSLHKRTAELLLTTQDDSSILTVLQNLFFDRDHYTIYEPSFESLIQASFESLSNTRQLSIYQSLLACHGNGPLSCFCATEEKFLLNYSPNVGEIPWPFTLLNAENGLTRFWQAYSLQVFAKRVHCMEYALAVALKLIQANHFQKAALCISPFPKLHALLLLLAWDLPPATSQFRWHLIETLWTPDSQNVPVPLRIACDRVFYQLNVAIWVAKSIYHISQSAPMADLPQDLWMTADKIYCDLQTTSLLAILYQEKVLHGTDLSPAHIYNLLQNEGPGSLSADVVLLHAYAAVDNSLSYFTTKSLSCLDAVSSHILSITDVADRVATLGIIFVSVFVMHTRLCNCTTGIKSVRRANFSAGLQALHTFLSLLSNILNNKWLPSPLHEANEFASNLNHYVHDCAFRLGIIGRLFQSANPPNNCFLSLALSDPESLLCLCLRYDNFSLCKEIAEFYAIKEPLLHRALVEQDLQSVFSTNNADKAISIIKKLLDDGSESLAYSLCLDLSINAPNKDCALAVLGIASGLTPGPSLSQYKDNIEELIAKLQFIFGAFPNAEPEILFSPFFMGCISYNPLVLQKLLNRQKFFENSYLSLCEILSQPSSVTLKTRIAKLQEGFDYASKTVLQNNVNVNTLENNYLGSLVGHVSACTLPSDVSLQTVLQRSPSRFLLDLVLTKHDYSTAHSLAESIGIDVFALVLKYIAGSPDKKSNRVAPEIVNFIGKKSELTASLLCLLSSTASQFSTVQQYALSHTRGCLFKWARNQVKIHSIISQAYTEESARDQAWTFLQSIEHHPHAADWEERHIQFYTHIVNEFISKHDWNSALMYSEQFLPKGPSDKLLLQAVEHDGKDVSQFLLRCSNKQKIIPTVLKLLPTWDINVAIDLLNMCKCHLKPQDPQWADICSVLHQMNAYSDITKIHPHWKDWRKLDEICKSDPALVVRDLLQLNQYNMARKIRHLLNVPNVKNEIEESCLLHMLLELNDTSAAMLTLCEMGTDAVGVVHALIDRVSVSTTLSSTKMQTKLFLIQFLLTNMATHVEQAEFDQLSKVETGLKILLLLPPNLQQQYEKLASYPHLIFESMIMDSHIDQLSTVIQRIPAVRDDMILLQYAIKALSLDIRPTPQPTPTLGSPRGSRQGSQVYTNIPTSKQGSQTYSGSPHGSQTYTTQTTSQHGSKTYTTTPQGSQTYTVTTNPTSSRQSSQTHINTDMPPPDPAPSPHFALSSAPPTPVLKHKESVPHIADMASIVCPDFLRNMRLVGDLYYDDEVRKNHRYSSCPNINLAKSLFDLCPNRILVAETCMKYFWDISNEIYAMDSYQSRIHTSELLEVARQLLLYTKQISSFLNLAHKSESHPTSRSPTDSPISPDESTASSSQLKDVEKAIEVVGLYTALLNAGCTFGLTLGQLFQPESGQKLLDKLIEVDRLSLAIDAAQKCGISPNKAWLRCGFALLKMGKYLDARNMFKSCLVPREEHKTNSEAAIETKRILDQILQILRLAPQLDENALRKRLMEMQAVSESPHANRNQYYDQFSVNSYLHVLHVKPAVPVSKPAFNQPLVTPIQRDECIFYLQTYGGKRALINFLVNNNMLENACKEAVAIQLSTQAFVEEVVLYCISHNYTSHLKQILSQQDSSLQSVMTYLTSACKHLNKKRAYDVLLDFQLFMQDFTRAGLTSVKMFLDTPPADVDVRLTHLVNAKQYFSDALSQRSTKMTTGELSQKVITSDLQISVTKLFIKEKKNIAIEVQKATLFGPPEERQAILEQLLLIGSFDLTYRIVQHFRMSSDVYTHTIHQLARRKQYSKLMELLKPLKTAIGESEWESVLLSVSQLIATEMSDQKTAKKLIEKLTSPRAQVIAYVHCGMVKQALDLALHKSVTDQLGAIREVAIQVNDTKTLSACEAAIAKLAATPTAPAQWDGDYSKLFATAPAPHTATTTSAAAASLLATSKGGGKW
ncbi:zinc finger FYVE domain protein [Pelomyxa schiedti]|nr:zinc finger FYVE domain protein [Pelomyxa schiedti]